MREALAGQGSTFTEYEDIVFSSSFAQVPPSCRGRYFLISTAVNDRPHTAKSAARLRRTIYDPHSYRKDY